MSDREVRALERRWRATGATEDGAAWIAARVRVGALSRADVEVAGYLGHPAARRALEWPAPLALPDASGGAVRGWVEGLDAWGQARLAAAALAVAKLAASGLGEVTPTLAALEAWVGCPCAPHARDVRAAMTASSGRGGRRARRHARVLAALAAAQVVDAGRAREQAGQAASHAVLACGADAVVDAVRRAVSPLAFPA